MSHDWMLDVLADLTTYARRNDLPALASRLEQTVHAARFEIAAQRTSRAEAESGETEWFRTADGQHYRGAM